MVTLTWDSQADWDAAQSRDRVITRSVGDRDGDVIQQGYDPQKGILTDAVGHWPFDEDSGSTVADVINGHDGDITGATPGVGGMLSSTALSFDGSDDRVIVPSMPLADPQSDWTLNLWVNVDDTSDYRAFSYLEDIDGDENLGVGNWDDGSLKIFSRGRTPGTGSQMPTDEWAMVTLVWENTDNLAHVYLNGEFDYTVDADSGDWLSGLSEITFGDRQLANDHPLPGEIDEPNLFPRQLTETEIQTLYETASSGSLTTDTQQSDLSATEIETTADIPPNTAIDVTVYQDVDGDGTPEYQQTVSVSDGTHTNSLSEFEGSSGADYWTAIETTTSDVMATAQFHAASISTVLQDAGSVTTSTTTTLLDNSPSPSLTDDGSVTQTAGVPIGSQVSTRSVSELDITDYVSTGDVVDTVLSFLDDDGVTITFPPGTYRLSSFVTDSDNINLVAPDGDVRLQILPSPSPMLDFSGDGWTVSGFEFDFSDVPGATFKATGSGWQITNCIWRGRMQWESGQYPQAISARVDYPKGDCHIANCYFPDGSGQPPFGGVGGAVKVLEESFGTLRVKDSWFEKWADGAVQMPPRHGPVALNGCYIRNTTNALRVNGPLIVRDTTFYHDGDSPKSVISSHRDMRCWIDGSRSDTSREIYFEDCDFKWDYQTGVGHPIDARTSNDDLFFYLCRFHNNTYRESIRIGGGAADIHRTAVSGTATHLNNTGGIVGTEELVAVDAPAADPTPPIPYPPATGETPDGDHVGTPTVGEPGGSYGRFYNVK